jgi:tRNA-2-methylthio-N6-dimethylallyladenosine synthase
MPKVFLKTYGCQMNERDSEQVARDLIARGYQMVDNESQADVVLLNTCSVRDMAEQKAIGKMGMLSRLRANKPEMVFGFLGCMAQSRGEELVRDIAGVDLVVGTQKFHRVAEYVQQLVEHKSKLREQLMDDARFSIVDVDEEPGSQETIKEHVLEA